MVTQADADRACAVAGFGMTMVDAADPDDIADLLALMLVTGRR